MKLPADALVLGCSVCLHGQHRFSWQDACFQNPAAPFCPGHEYAVKPAGKNAKGADSQAGTWPLTPSTVDAAGIDWRFADPLPDALAVLNSRKLLVAPYARNLIEQLAAKHGLGHAEVQSILRGFSSVDRLALSVRDNRVVLMVIGRAEDAVLPAPEPGWKAVPLAGNALLLGDAKAVDQAVQRISTAAPLSQLALLASGRQADTELWAAGSATLAGPDAANVGVKRFTLTASIDDKFRSDTTFELNPIPEPSALQSWLKTMGDARMDGTVVVSTLSMAGGETLQNLDKIVLSPVGEHLAFFIKSARNLPLRDTPTTVHTKPVIYGLDEGAKEVK